LFSADRDVKCNIFDRAKPIGGKSVKRN